MERGARHRKSKSASGIEGIAKIQKQKSVSRLSSDTRSYLDGRNRDDMSQQFMFEFGQSSLGRGIGVPMKKLLAEEMSKEVESKKRSPSVIARLMGLEALPSPRHVHRQQQRFSDSYQQKNASFSTQRNNSQLYDGRSGRRSSMEQQEFKDVYEDLEASHIMNRHCSSRWNTSSILSKREMELIQQKFLDAKRLSTDEKFQDSNKLDDALEMLGSNKDLLLKFLRQPDSLLAKHLHEPQVDPGSSFGSHIAVLKPSSPQKYQGKAKTCRPYKHNVTSHVKREDGLLLEPHSRHRAHISRKSSKIQMEQKNEDKILPTRIVVLKPNLGKTQNGGLPSPDISNGYLPNFKKMKDYSNIGVAGTITSRRKDSSHNVGFVDPKSREAREIAREITRRMRDGCDETMDAKSIAFRGYAGDESSVDANESDSGSEFEVFKFSARKSFDDSNLRRYPSSCLVESSVTREAKKRLSERWKMTHKYQDLEMVDTVSTLGEMLALPDKETRSRRLNAKTSLGRANNQNDTGMWGGPLGISSKDGWKDDINRKARSRSLPPSIGGRGYRRSTFHHELAEDNNMLRNKNVRRSRSKVVKGNTSHCKKPHSCQHVLVNEVDTSSEANFEIQMEANIKELSEQEPLSLMPAKEDNCRSPVFDVMMIAEHGSTALSLNSSELLPNLSSVLDGDKSALHDQEDSSFQKPNKGPPQQVSASLQCPGTELDSSESSKEADHPSPISVLEAPYSEDASSESFERVSAELNELRMQLRLLKMESGTDAESSSLCPIEEEVTQLSPTFSEANYTPETESWEISYALDVLIDSGLEESNFDIFRTNWHSPNCPLDPNLFDNLEKKYSNETNMLRSERKLLFDRINSALLEIFHERVDSFPWVKPKLAGSDVTWLNDEILDAIEQLINQEFTNMEISDTALDREMQWSDYRGEVDAMGNEIEKMLIDDLIIEVLM